MELQLAAKILGQSSGLHRRSSSDAYLATCAFCGLVVGVSGSLLGALVLSRALSCIGYCMPQFSEVSVLIL